MSSQSATPCTCRPMMYTYCNAVVQTFHNFIIVFFSSSRELMSLRKYVVSSAKTHCLKTWTLIIIALIFSFIQTIEIKISMTRINRYRVRGSIC